MCKKLLSLFLVLLLLTGSLVSCDFSSDREKNPLPSEETSIESETESESESESESEEAYPDLVLAEDGECRYTVIIPKNYDSLTYYSALNLVDVLKNDYGVTIPFRTDDQPKGEYEILIGLTNREESSIAEALPDGKYLLKQQDGKLILRGKNIQICAAVGALVQAISGDDTLTVSSIPTENVYREFLFPDTYRSAILMIGDGMGHNHINLTVENDYEPFYARYLPVAGDAITRSQNVIEGSVGYTDSAASGTALATGYKTYNGVIGKDKNYRDVQNVRELADASGAKTAILTTDSITGATPAAFLCHNDSRNNTWELQTYIDRLQNQKKIEYCRGEVGDELTDATRTALSKISADGSAFFMMVEEAYTDKGGHSNNANQVINAVIRFNNAIAYVIPFVFCHPDTVLIITADHETGGIVPDDNTFFGYRFTSDTHTNTDVPVYAIGAKTEVFHNTRTENIDIAKFIAKAYSSKAFGQ